MICLLNSVFSSGLDLNFVESQTWGFSRISAQNLHAPRQARICATHALSATEHVSPLCGRPQRGAQGQRLLVSGSVLRHGFRSVDLPRVFARHRSQPSCPSPTAVPHGFSLSDDFAQHAGQCERHTPMANLRRLRTTPDWFGASSVCYRAVRTGTRRGGLRVRRQHHRLVFVGVRLGAVSIDQGRHQTAHTVGFEGQYPQLSSASPMARRTRSM
jgi:hypothetical protein